MNIVLIEDPIYSIDSLKESVKKSFPISSQITINRKNYYESLKLVKTSPLLTEGWAIILSSSLSIKQCSLFCTDDKNVVLIEVRPRNKEEYLSSLNDIGVEFSVVDNVHVGKDRLVKYCIDELYLSKKDSITLCNRCNNYLPYVTESVTLLKSLGKGVSRSDILKYVNKRSSFNIQSLFLHLIGFNRKESDTVACFVYDFRYAMGYIKKSLLAYLEDCINIYIYMENGLLGADNYKDFGYPNKLTVSEYLVKKIIMDIHPVVPLDVIINVKISIEKMNKVYELLNII